MEILSNCLICNSENLTPFIKAQDYTVSKEWFQIVRCQICGFKFTNPRPNPDEIGAYYESEEYISHSNTQKGLINVLYHWVRRYTLSAKARLIQQRMPNKNNLLDIGCGSGAFLAFMAKEGWNCTGIEPSEKARAYAKQNYGLAVYEPLRFFELPAQNYEVITMWHVLEHVHLLNEYIVQLKKLLKPGGLLLIAVPNSQAAEAEHYGAAWAAYDVPRHLYHFAPSDMENLLQKHQITLLEKKRMPFDAFYVAMLSERYQNHSWGLARAFWQGVKSNALAQKDINLCSSLIYLCQTV